MMAENKPSKNELVTIFNKLKTVPANKQCFDCGAKNPSWASVSFGVFICIECSATHRSLGVHISFVRSTQLDTNWTWLQVRSMQVGGNDNALAFFQQHDCTTKDSQLKYNSRAAQLYKEKLASLTSQAMRKHGTELLVNLPTGAGTASGSSVDDKSEYKPVIGTRKPISKRGGLGSKRGLGAQRIDTDFSKIEKEATMAEEKNAMARSESKALSNEEMIKTIEEIDTTYKSLGERARITEEKLRTIDPIKAQQFERLGMGFSDSKKSHSGVSHSASSDMMTLEQTNPIRAEPSREASSRIDFESLGDTFILPIKQKSNKFFDDFDRDLGFKRDNDIPEIIDDIPSIDEERKRPTVSRSSTNAYAEPSSSDVVAQKKFGKAKAISSDQYFNDGRSSEHEQRTVLSRFEGSNAISSDAFFGRANSNSSSNSYTSGLSNVTANLYDVKEGVRDGVSRVAGRLSSLATDVMSSFHKQ